MAWMWIAPTAQAAPLWEDVQQHLQGQWTAPVDGGQRTIDVVYEPLSGGTIIAERFGTGPRQSLTVYHPDGDSVLATHYCPQGNQPRLRARRRKGDKLTFDFADVTNRKKDQSMLRSLTYSFSEGPHVLVRTEIYVGPDGKDEVTTLRFVKQGAVPAHKKTAPRKAAPAHKKTAPRKAAPN